MSARLGAPTGSRRPEASRDQGESPFARILSSLVRRVPGARAAALVDVQGETVDYAGRATPFDVRVSAAEFRLIFRALQAHRSLTTSRWLIVGATRGSYLAYGLPDEYALVVIFTRTGGFSGWHRAVVVCAAELATEARWTSRSRIDLGWRPVSVDADPRGRPRALHAGSAQYPVDILGRIVPREAAVSPPLEDAIAARERAWRVRVATHDGGMELTLVRAPGGNWYADEDLDEAGTSWRTQNDR
jgi:hypothetical protein